jgi:hypothetical protein
MFSSVIDMLFGYFFFMTAVIGIALFAWLGPTPKRRAQKPIPVPVKPNPYALLNTMPADQPTIPFTYNDKGELLDRLSGEPITRFPLN